MTGPKALSRCSGNGVERAKTGIFTGAYTINPANEESLAPFAPHLAEELWERLGKTGSTYRAAWPTFDDDDASEEEVTLIIQVNGKLRDRLTVPANTSAELLEQRARSSEKVQSLLASNEVRKVVVVSGKLINIVVG